MLEYELNKRAASVTKVSPRQIEKRIVVVDDYSDFDRPTTPHLLQHTTHSHYNVKGSIPSDVVRRLVGILALNVGVKDCSIVQWINLIEATEEIWNRSMSSGVQEAGRASYNPCTRQRCTGPAAARAQNWGVTDKAQYGTLARSPNHIERHL